MSSKAADRAALDRLAPDITRALAERKERERSAQLAAPEPAKQRRDALDKAGALSQGIPIDSAKYRAEKLAARAQQLKDQISVGAAKIRERQGRKNAAAPEDLGPTPERLAKEEAGAVVPIVPPIASGGMRVNARAFTVAGPVERYKKVLPQDLLAVAVQAVTDILTAESGPKITASYDGVPVTSFGARHGGVQDYVREKTALVDEMRATLDRDFLEVIDWVITATVIKPSGEAMTLADAGRKISPWKPGEKDTAVGFGRLYQTLARLREFYGAQSALGKQTTPPSPDEVRRLLTVGASRLQRRREQYGRYLEDEEKKRRMQSGGR